MEEPPQRVTEHLTDLCTNACLEGIVCSVETLKPVEFLKIRIGAAFTCPPYRVLFWQFTSKYRPEHSSGYLKTEGRQTVNLRCN